MLIEYYSKQDAQVLYKIYKIAKSSKNRESCECIEACIFRQQVLLKTMEHYLLFIIVVF